MAQPLISVVIICKNEVSVISATIDAALQLTPHIIVVDTGSTDGTVDLLQQKKVTIVQSEWLGFGPIKNKGIAAAPTNWILSLDADEVIDELLIKQLSALPLQDERIAYNIAFINYFNQTPLHYGEWSGDWHIRLFNKNNAIWNDAAVHETLVFQQQPMIQKLKGNIHHKTIDSAAALREKFEYYAQLNAKKYINNKQKKSPLKKYVSPLFNFIKNYVFKLGFLDGKAGWIVARENFIYTYKKYHYLQALIKKQSD